MPLKKTSTFTIPVPPGFNLTTAICSYGYFLLAPNRWDPKTQCFHRPLRGLRDRVIHTTLHPTPRGARALRVTTTAAIKPAERALLTKQIARMLRLDESPAVFRGWHRLCPDARRARYGRLFRSPTLFEDIIKTFTGCNVTWRNTMTMNRLLSAEVGRGAFPTPAELAAVTPAWLKRRCKVGYRAERIVRLARDVVSGKLDLAGFEDPRLTTEEVYERLLEVYGVGDYAAGNLCQLLGRYDRLAIDTETYRHFEQEHNLPRGENPRLIHPRIEAHYAPYAPYQFLKYWYDLWRGYERHSGAAKTWEADLMGGAFTATNLKRDGQSRKTKLE